MEIWICFAAFSVSDCVYRFGCCDHDFFVALNCVYLIYQTGGYRTDSYHNDGSLSHVFYGSAGKVALYESAKVQTVAGMHSSFLQDQRLSSKCGKASCLRGNDKL